MKHLLFTAIFLPRLVFAAPTTFSDLVDIFLDIISSLIPLIFGLTLLVLIWGIIKAWVLHGDNETEVEQGKKLVVIGIVVLVIMSGLWGILAMLRSSIFGI